MANSNGGFFNRFLDFIGLVDDEGDGNQDQDFGMDDGARVYTPSSRRAVPEGRPMKSAQQQGYSSQERYSPNSGRQDPYARSGSRAYEEGGNANRSGSAGGYVRSSGNPYEHSRGSGQNYESERPYRNEQPRANSGRNPYQQPNTPPEPREYNTQRVSARDDFASPGRSAATRPPQQPQQDRTRGNVVNLRQDGRHQTVIYYLHSLEECRGVINDLIDNKTVLLNLEEMDERLIQRGIDMLSGAAFALNATLRKASDRTYLIAPISVEVALTNDVERRY